MSAIGAPSFRLLVPLAVAAVAGSVTSTNVAAAVHEKTVHEKKPGKRTPPKTTVHAETALVGLFKLDPGSAPAGRAPSGSYFEIVTSNGTPFPNLTSSAQNKDFTPLTAGVDGGLKTGAYQPAPSPAFNGILGGAEAADIIEPVDFDAIDFSVATQPVDPQTKTGDPAPQITDAGGALTGQLTAWAAQWNDQSFNQGTPKPGGGMPAPTTAVTGTYDATTGRFTLTWKSRISAGLLNGLTGVWHLAGTFIPANELP